MKEDEESYFVIKIGKEEERSCTQLKTRREIEKSHFSPNSEKKDSRNLQINIRFLLIEDKEICRLVTQVVVQNFIFLRFLNLYGDLIFRKEYRFLLLHSETCI